MKSLIVLAVLAVLVPACAFTPQAVVLKPEIQPTLVANVQGRTVYLTVVDERPRQTLGTRRITGERETRIGAELTAAGDLSNTVRTAVADGLQCQGFVITSQKTNDENELRVEIRNLDYFMGAPSDNINLELRLFKTCNLRTLCELKGICNIGSARPYEKLYREEHWEIVPVVLGKKAKERYINSAISKAINLLLQDSELIHCLAQKS